MSDSVLILFLSLLFSVAFLYASVGHGGASGYLALMALFSFTPDFMKSSGIIMNIFVSVVVFYRYFKSGHFKWKLFYPFAVTSIPASFAGAFISVDELLYKRILGLLLLFPILRLTGLLKTNDDVRKELNFITALFIGALIGFLSGMIGIGGGIILSPIILLMHWGDMKETAAVSALFIFVNSISGLIALLGKGVSLDPSIYVYVAVAIMGGFAGSYFGSKIFSNPLLKKILAIVLFIASLKLLTEPGINK